MKIFVAGATGAIGSRLVPQLVARGHDVVGTTRSAARAGALRALGAESVVVDALDPDSVADAVAKAEPEVVVHQLTALSGPADRRPIVGSHKRQKVESHTRRAWVGQPYEGLARSRGRT
ncbi:NAD-dependent epimerase/dehydratase family protein [Streptomyces sp. NPDC059153]|uniref:NAD-dependent epimerase/dehydratase family protein n=1 Tax=unclassified Streptomyces TaxID=2593676 RepID=UPI0036BA4A9F